MGAPQNGNTCGVVVTFDPDANFSERVAQVATQIPAVVIVDNHSDAPAVAMLRDISSRPNTNLILNSENLGIASALNIGVRHAIAAGYEWALLVDQDTVPAGNIVDGLLEAYNHFPQRDRVGIVGSNYVEAQTGKARWSLESAHGLPWMEKTVVITSGSLMSLQAYQIIGPFREEYFIDCVDTEYCLRARSKGFKVIMTSKPLMAHTIGQPTKHRLPWRELDASDHNHIRRYYMIRNHIDLAKKYVLREPAWVLASLWMRVKSMIVLCLFEKDRLVKVRYSAMGLFDGLFSNFSRKLS
jgi:rhamnosyltransferase